MFLLVHFGVPEPSPARAGDGAPGAAGTWWVSIGNIHHWRWLLLLYQLHDHCAMQTVKLRLVRMPYQVVISQLRCTPKAEPVRLTTLSKRTSWYRSSSG